MSFISIDQVPFIHSALTTEEAAAQLIPASFAEMVSTDIVDSQLVLTFSKANKGSTSVIIPKRLYNPLECNFAFPQFIFNKSTFSETYVDYSKERLIINQNELVYLTLHHRLTQLSKWNHHYASLVKADLKEIGMFAEYMTTTSHNSRLKCLNSYVVLKPWTDSKFVIERPIGDLFGVKSSERTDLDRLFRDLSIQPASESMGSDSSKFVVQSYEKELYQAAGYGIQDNELITIFPIKPNIPARLKSHVLADAYHFVSPSDPIFVQDRYENNSTLKTAVVVFDHIESNGRLLCGEIEASESFTSNLIYKDEIIRARFDEMPVVVGQVIESNGNNIFIGEDIDGNEIYVNRAKRLTVTKIEHDLATRFAKINVQSVKEMGAGRIYSSTGLKGVTKPSPYKGFLDVHFVRNTSIDRAKLNVDLVIGMNSFKAGQNGILLAQAALLAKLQNLSFVNSLDESEVNRLASQIVEVYWTDENGNTKPVLAGIVQVSVNELAETYSHVKLQSFQPESCRYLKQGGYKELYSLLVKEGIRENDKELLFELQKIWVDQLGLFAKEDEIPVYTPESLRTLKVFSPLDLVFDVNSMFPIESKLLDESYNKGWCLDLRYRNGGIIRFPSAKLLNALSAEMIDGTYKYPTFLINVSQIIETCITPDEHGNLNIGYLNDKNASPKSGSKALVARYLTNVRNAIYAPQDLADHLNVKTNLVEMLLKPKLFGTNMKQVCDALVPQGTVVILDRKIYKHLANLNKDFYQKNNVFYGLCVRNPVIWKSMVMGQRVWSADHFAEHLSKHHNILLDKYLSAQQCRDLLLINPQDSIRSQADCDGDIMPLFIPTFENAQQLLSKMNSVEGIQKEETQWIEEYRKGEEEANSKLNMEKSKGMYTLYKLPFKVQQGNKPSFNQFFINSIVAKGDVGPATIHNWAINALLEIYQSKCFAEQVFIKKGNKWHQCSITQRDIDFISYAYSRLVQDMVVRGIKHCDDGSAGFQPFLLSQNMLTKNRNVISAALSKMNISLQTLDVFFEFIHWIINSGFKDSMLDFIKLHNSGKEPKNGFNPLHFEDIVSICFYGQAVSELYALTNKVLKATEHGFVYSAKLASKQQVTATALPDFL